MSSDRRLIRGACVLGLGAFALAAPRPARAETGYDLWLRYAPVPSAELRGEYRVALQTIVVQGRSPTAAIIAAELERGVAEARAFEERWAALRGRVDAERHQAVLAKLHQQSVDAAQWRDKILRYFQTLSGRPIAAASPAP